MDKNYFIEKLKENNINLDEVCFNDNVKDDTFCVLENYQRFEVFYRERGGHYQYKCFYSKKDAAKYLIEIMK